jgi:hypothetical protein
VKHDLYGAARALALPTAALIGVAALAPGWFEVALRIYALVLTAAIVVLALLALRRAFPPETALDLSSTRARSSQVPPSLARVQNEVILGVASSFDLHYRLVPRLRATATGLLASRRNVRLTVDSARAHALLGDDAWELVRPDRAAPRDRLTTGIPTHELEQVVDTLERV